MELFPFRRKDVLQLGIIMFERLVVCDQGLQDFLDFRVVDVSGMPQLLKPR